MMTFQAFDLGIQNVHREAFQPQPFATIICQRMLETRVVASLWSRVNIHGDKMVCDKIIERYIYMLKRETEKEYNGVRVGILQRYAISKSVTR